MDSEKNIDKIENNNKDEIRSQEIEIENIMHNAYLQYSLSVNVGRAIPDVRDGLKCSSRRILYAMHTMGLNKSHSYVKSAKVVGLVIGNYHPHGDSSVYEALVRMAQNFSMRYPLIDGQGNFGSIDGDPPAAYRYTECKMEKLAEELMQDIDKNTVNMIPTFDSSKLEPEVLPSKIPNLLINGSTGIGVGMATNIPPHNLREVIDALLAIIDNTKISIDELMQNIKGPDFPTSAQIIGINGIKKLYHTGHGVIKLRAKSEVIKSKKDNRNVIIINELPYSINKENLVKNIAELIKNKKIENISSLRDETSKRVGIRIVIELKKGSQVNIVLNQLYKHTQLETKLACTFLVVDDMQPKIMNLKQILQKYINHRLTIVTNRTKYELEKAKNRIEIVNGLIVAINNINTIIKIVKKSQNKQDAIEEIMNTFSLTKKQSIAILDMKLNQLTNLAIIDLNNEYNKLDENINIFNNLLDNRNMRLDLIKNELNEVKDKYTKINDRKTTIDLNSSNTLETIDLILNYDCVIILSDKNYIQKIKTNIFKTQHRGGKGTRGMKTKDEDLIKHIITACNYDKILFFTDKGIMYQLDAYKIQESINKTNKGKAIINLINIKQDEHISVMIPIKNDIIKNKNLFFMFATKNGYVKKTKIMNYNFNKKVGLKAIKIKEKDSLVSVSLINGNCEILLSSTMGLTCRFKECDIKSSGRLTKGVYGMRLKLYKDYINNMITIPNVNMQKDNNTNNTEDYILTILNTGIGKKCLHKNYRLTHRNASGVINIKLKHKEKVVSTLYVNKNDEVIITTKSGQIIRISANEIRTVGRMARGVKIVNLNNDFIINATKINHLQQEDINNYNKETT